MGEVPQIVDFEKVVNPHLNGGKLVSYKSRYLTKPGDNYGSIMLGITAMVEKADGHIEELCLVAKLPPITNDLYWNIFQPERTCLAENAIYISVMPAVRQLQRESGVPEDELFDGFTRYYGSRISLNPEATQIDRDAVLVLKNLQTSGFKPGNRHKMYDINHTKVALTYLAQYHALPIALKFKKPEFYAEHVEPYFGKFYVGSNMPDEEKEAMDKQAIDDVKEAVDGDEAMAERVTKVIQKSLDYMNSDKVPDSIYNTLIHDDCWINNLMFRYDENGKPEKMKIVDFQCVQIGSLMHDLFFFLLSSVEYQVIEDNYDDLMKFYYKAFIECLEKVKVPTDIYTYQSFLDEIQKYAPLQVRHALFMTKIVLMDNVALPEDFKDVSLDVVNTSLSKNVKDRMAEIIRLSDKLDLL